MNIAAVAVGNVCMMTVDVAVIKRIQMDGTQKQEIHRRTLGYGKDRTGSTRIKYRSTGSIGSIGLP